MRTKASFTPDLILEEVSFGGYFHRKKGINDEDLSRKESRKIKKKFEQEILHNLGSWESYDISFYIFLFQKMVRYIEWISFFWIFLVSYQIFIFILRYNAKHYNEK
jgi:hypothetical protein